MTDKTSTSESDNSSLTTDTSKETEAYSQICHTASISIHWLIFAIAVCSGGIALCLATFHFGNLNFAIQRRGEIQKICWDCDKCADQTADMRTNSNSYKTTFNSNNASNNSPPLPGGGSTNGDTSTVSGSLVNRGNAQPIKTDETREIVESSVSTKPSRTVCDQCAEGKYKDKKKPESCAKLDEKENEQVVQSYAKLVGETRTVTLPILNLKLVLTDFVLVIIIIGLFFWFWLRHTLLFTRSVLCSLYNSGNCSGTINHTISAYFLLLWSGGARRRLSNVPQYIFIFFLLAIVGVIISDVYEQVIYPYTWFGKFAESYIRQPGYYEFLPYLIGKILIEIAALLVGRSLFMRTRSMIKDIRNLLILIEWSQRSFYPVMYKLFEKLKIELSETYNEVSYQEEDKEDGEFELKFRCKFKDSGLIENKSGADPNLGEIFSAIVDLPKKAKEFANRLHKDRQAPDWMLEGEEKFGRSTFEQRRMKRFFCELLVMREFGGEISENFYEKIIEKILENRPDLKPALDIVIADLSSKYVENPAA